MFQKYFNLVRQISQIKVQLKNIRERMDHERYKKRIMAAWLKEVRGSKKLSLYAQAIVGILLLPAALVVWVIVEFFQQSGWMSELCARGWLIVTLVITLTAVWRLWKFFLEADTKLTRAIEAEYEEEIARQRAATLAQSQQGQQAQTNRTRYEQAAERRQPMPEGVYTPPPRRS